MGRGHAIFLGKIRPKLGGSTVSAFQAMQDRRLASNLCIVVFFILLTPGGPCSRPNEKMRVGCDG